MKNILYILIGFICLAFLTFGSGCILNARVYDLNLDISKSQILNYEFSSELLKLRFQESITNQEDLGSEVNLLIMESNVLNSDTNSLNKNLSYKEKMGEYFINSIRFLVVKPLIFLNKDNENLKKLQQAFYYEKSQNCTEALKIYNELEKIYNKSRSDDYAFVLLHIGYCQAIVGDIDTSINQFQKVIQEFSGTHFSESSQVLLNILNNNSKKKAKTENSIEDPILLARNYFQLGLYQDSIKEFNKVESLSANDLFIKGRSLEKIGKLQEAVNIYLDLTIGKDEQVAKKANRRLMLIGNFYNGGEELAEISKINAIKINDMEASNFIETSKKQVLTSIVFNKSNREISNQKITNNSDTNTSNQSAPSQFKIDIDPKFKNNPPNYLINQPIVSENKIKNKTVEVKKENLFIQENKKILQPDCLQFTSKSNSKIHKAEKVLLMEGNFVTTYQGVTKATPIDEFKLLESCVINSPFTIGIENQGKLTVKKAEITSNHLLLHTESGIQKVLLKDVMSIIPDSYLENFHYLVVKRQDNNLHYCNFIEVNDSNIYLVSNSGAKISKSLNEIKMIYLGENTSQIQIQTKKDGIFSVRSSINILNSNFEFRDDTDNKIKLHWTNIVKIIAE